MPIIRMIFPVLTLISAHSFFSLRGMPDSINSIHLIFGFLLLFSLSYLFRFYFSKITQMCGSRVVCIMYISLLCLASLFCYSIRIYIYSNIGIVFSDLLTVFIGICSVSGSGGQIIPHSSPSPANSSSEDSFGLQVLSEPWPVNHNFGFESSLQNRIRTLENQHCIFLLDKEKGEYWLEVKKELDACTSQREYNRVLDFENRDLQIREQRHNCFSIFQQILSENPTLADKAVYNPQSAFVDLLEAKRTEIDEQGGIPLERDRRELTFLTELSHDLSLNGQNSLYIKTLFE